MAHTHQSGEASGWVKRFASSVPEGEVLDLASGYGRHARLFAALGHPVLAVDRDSDALAACAGEGISTIQTDLENGTPWPFASDRFAGVVIANYLHRPLFPHIFDSLADQGVLLVETFAVGNGQFGKPSNPDFLLASGELLALASAYTQTTQVPLRVIACEDGYVDQPKPAMIQRICLVKGDISASSRLFPLI